MTKLKTINEIKKKIEEIEADINLNGDIYEDSHEALISLKAQLQTSQDIYDRIKTILDDCRIDSSSLTWKELHYFKNELNKEKSLGGKNENNK